MRSKLALGGLAVAVAFLLVTNPVVVEAAGQITSKHIKNNSVKGKDIKDDTLTGGDILESSLTGVNAATVGGLASSALQNSVIRVPVAATATASTFTKALPTSIPNGTYLVTINVNANVSAAGVGVFCGLYVAPGVGNALMGSFGSNYGTTGTFSSINAAKVVTVSSPLSLFCASSGTFSTPITVYNTSEITFTKLDTVTTTSPVARGTNGESHSGSAPRP
jgi:hypothetical protein